MSTKVFNGYRYPAAGGAPMAVRGLLARAAPVYQDLALEAVGTAALLLAEVPEGDPGHLRAALRFISSGQLAPEDFTRRVPSTLFGQAAVIIDAVQQRLAMPAARKVPPLFDLAFEVVFAADPEPEPGTDGYGFALLYTDRAEFEQVWEQTGGVEPWPYWDNQVPDQAVSEEEWDLRRRAWDRITGGEAPARVGVTWRFAPRYPLEIEAAAGEWLTISRALDRIDVAARRQPGRLAAQRAQRLAGGPLPWTAAVAGRPPADLTATPGIDPGGGRAAGAEITL